LRQALTGTALRCVSHINPFSPHAAPSLPFSFFTFSLFSAREQSYDSITAAQASAFTMRSSIASRSHTGRVSMKVALSYLLDWVTIILAAVVGGVLSLVVSQQLLVVEPPHVL
jgi:hypothetical protein